MPISAPRDQPIYRSSRHPSLRPIHSPIPTGPPLRMASSTCAVRRTFVDNHHHHHCAATGALRSSPLAWERGDGLLYHPVILPSSTMCMRLDGSDCHHSRTS
ncbi:hypothetical protein C8Q73DRAFT_688283 [Cubamyces lactineus]|nr:hypothetical protein C8Q73DRAFT_688283 [Cubamyces lactineus]